MSKKIPKDFKSNNADEHIGAYHKHNVEMHKPVRISRELLKAVRTIHKMRSTNNAKKLDELIENNLRKVGITDYKSQTEHNTLPKENSNLELCQLLSEYGYNDCPEPILLTPSNLLDDSFDFPPEVDNPVYWLDFSAYLAFEDYFLDSIMAGYEVLMIEDFYEDCGDSEPTDNNS